MSGLIEFVIDAFQKGGWGMWPILGCLVVSVAIAVERAITLGRATFDVRGFMQDLRARLGQRDFAGAAEVCKRTNKPLTRIIGAGLEKSAAGEAWVLAGMDEAAYNEVPRIEKRTGYLALLGNVATLMGLFGTIIGLIHSFAGVSQAGAEVSEKATLLAAGISEAMYCTAFGLLTGISALFFYSILNGKTQAVIDDINYNSHRAFRLWKAANTTGEEPFVHHAIKTPGSHLMDHVGLFSGGGHGHGRKSTFANLQLTPLIDMFIVMVIFLLMSFSASGEILAVSKDIKLPYASEVDKLQRVPVVAITHPAGDALGGVVTLEGHEVATTRELMEDESPDWKIAKLTEQLEVKKHNWKVTNPDKQFQGELIVQADQNVDFKIIKKIMYSAGLAGYGNILFAVTKKAKAGEGGGGH